LIFHLLSSTDLTNVRKANAHFSEDLLSALLNEPIPGQGIYWSSVGGKPYPVAIRALSFEQMYRRLDENYDRAAVPTFAAEMKREFDEQLQEAMSDVPVDRQSAGNGRSPVPIPGSDQFLDFEDSTRRTLPAGSSAATAARTSAFRSLEGTRQTGSSPRPRTTGYAPTCPING
jgi:hypothetical protein